MSFEDQIASATRAGTLDGVCDAARWRGQCVDHYAQIEFLVATGLRELWSLGHKASAQPPFTYRMKIAALRDAVATGSFAPYPRLQRALDQLYDDCDRRNLIVHARGTISETPAGDWIWTGCYFPAEGTDIAAKAITQAEAQAMETDLRRIIQSLNSQLSCLGKKAVTK